MGLSFHWSKQRCADNTRERTNINRCITSTTNLALHGDTSSSVGGELARFPAAVFQKNVAAVPATILALLFNQGWRVRRNENILTRVRRRHLATHRRRHDHRVPMPVAILRVDLALSALSALLFLPLPSRHYPISSDIFPRGGDLRFTLSLARIPSVGNGFFPGRRRSLRTCYLLFPYYPPRTRFVIVCLLGCTGRDHHIFWLVVAGDAFTVLWYLPCVNVLRLAPNPARARTKP